MALTGAAGMSSGTMAEGAPAEPFWPNAGRVVAIAVAFILVTSLFAWLLRPLAMPPEDGLVIPLGPAPVQPTPDQRTMAAPAAANTPPAAAPTPAAVVPPGPHLAVLVTDFPPDAGAGKALIDRLPTGVAVALAPAHPALTALADHARQRGHEVWIGLPMEPKGYPKVSPGPNTLTLDASADENRRRLAWALARLSRPAGVYTMMGSAFTANRAAMAPIAEAVAKAGLPLIDSHVIGATVAADSVAAAGGRAISNRLFLDDVPTRAATAAKLDRAARLAAKEGRAVVLARALPATADLLAGFDAKAAGVAFVPPSVLMTP